MDMTPIQRAQAAKARKEAAAKLQSSTTTAAAEQTHDVSTNSTSPPLTNTDNTTTTPSSSKLDPTTKNNLSRIPLLKTKAGPRDGAQWITRLREEYASLIKFVSNNKESDNDWFRISSSDKRGVKWSGTCWYYHDSLKYEFDLEFEIPVTYPAVNPELRLPELTGKTAKMYRDGKICLTEHFMPLWNRNVPKFGIAHALALGLGPWLAAEIPDLVSKGLIQPNN